MCIKADCGQWCDSDDYCNMTTAATMVLRSATRFWDASSTKLQLDPGHIFLFNTVALASCVLAAYVIAVFTSSHGDQSIPQKRGIPIIGSWAFFTRRYTFLEEGLERLGRAFRFNILRVRLPTQNVICCTIANS